jgi:hypothetical protein
MVANATSSPVFPTLLGEEFFLLNSALDQTYDVLYQVSLTPALNDYWATAFGSSFDRATAESITFQWQNQDFSGFPTVEVLSAEDISNSHYENLATIAREM